MVYFDRNSLFSIEPESWVNGPDYRVIYDEYKSVGIYDQITPAFFNHTFETLVYEVGKLDGEMVLQDNQWDLLEVIYKHYGTMGHDRLLMLTHSEKPWNEARKGLSLIEYSDNKFFLESMYSYYKE